MTDDELRAALALAHEHDRPPAFAATLAAARAHRRPALWAPALAALVGAVALAAIVLLAVRSPAPVQRPIALDGIGMRSTSLQLPTDSLLAIPDDDLMSSPLRLDQGALP